MIKLSGSKAQRLFEISQIIFVIITTNTRNDQQLITMSAANNQAILSNILKYYSPAFILSFSTLQMFSVFCGLPYVYTNLSHLLVKNDKASSSYLRP